MNSIRKSLGMRETKIAREPSRLWNPHFYAILAQVHNTLYSPGSVFPAEQEGSVPPTSCPRFVPTRGIREQLTPLHLYPAPQHLVLPPMRQGSVRCAEIPDWAELCTIVHLDLREFLFHALG